MSYAGLALAAAMVAVPEAQAFDPDTKYIGQVAGLQPGSQVPVSPFIAGTDLGFTTKYGEDMDGNPAYQILVFGDTFYGIGNGDVNHGNDDATAYFSFANTDASTPVPAPIPAGWIQVGPDLDTGGESLEMGGARTPVGVAQFGDWEPWWGLFLRGGEYATCTSDADCEGLVCDKTMGLVDNIPLMLLWPLLYPETPFPEASAKVACWEQASSLPICHDVDFDPDKGLCRDLNSPMATYENDLMFMDNEVDNAMRSERGKVLSTASVMQLGRAQTGAVYPTTPWVTNKFLNATMRTTRGFSDYRSADDASDGGEMLWIWGRPSFWQKKDPTAGIPNDVQNAGNDLYLAATLKFALDDMVDNDLGQVPLWYYAGNGTFTINQTDAVPVDMDVPWEDGVSGHTSVTFVEGLNKWVMLYGGGTPALWDVGFGGELAAALTANDPRRNVEGRIKMRIADHPWGPWSAPEDVLDRDDEEICGYVWSPEGNACNEDADLAPWGITAVVGQPSEGVFYGTGIVEDWTEWDGNKATIGWFVSTFNPYKVQQMRTEITNF
ncbi:MAG: hypothetical protein OXU20_19230 [Myxococcales bacterium]|nr:hypothetical protein [Myxococcales bacterium]MDD9970296.1 hypothetical protein [Myxococcales bacterium]